MVFFVLSGLFVGGSVLKSGERFRPGEYAVARLTRLWVVLLPALAVTFVTDEVVSIFAPEALQGAYYGLWHSGPSTDQSYSLSAWTLLGNVFFIHTILTPVFGTNGPLWSLANEFWYYATFPLLAYAVGSCGRSKPRLGRVAAGVFGVAILSFLPDDMLSGYLVWLMGVAVYIAGRGLSCRKRPLAGIATFVLFAASIAYTKSGVAQAAIGIPGNYVVGGGFSLFCVVIAAWPPPQGTRLQMMAKRVAGAMSEFSYSLYLSHFPFLMLIAVFGYGCAKELPDKSGVLHFFAALALLLSLGAVFWALFERHTSALRAFASRRLLARRP